MERSGTSDVSVILCCKRTSVVKPVVIQKGSGFNWKWWKKNCWKINICLYFLKYLVTKIIKILNCPTWMNEVQLCQNRLFYMYSLSNYKVYFQISEVTSSFSNALDYLDFALAHCHTIEKTSYYSRCYSVKTIKAGCDQ